MPHRALQTPDIAREICEHIYSVSQGYDISLWHVPGREARRDLLHLALTCRSLLSPALDRLWWAIDDLKHLFKLIPGFKAEPVGYFISIPSAQRDFLAYNRYARRVYFYESLAHESILPSACFEVLQARNGEPLLPSLRYFSAEGGTSVLAMLLSPSVHSIRAWEKRKNALELSKPQLWATINALRSKAVNIRHLALGDDIGLPSECMDSISNLDNLTRLEFFQRSIYRLSDHILDFISLQKLSKLPNLRHFVFNGRFDLDLQGVEANQQESPFFPSLAILEFTSPASTIFQINTFLEMGVFPELQDFKLSLDHEHDFWYDEEYRFLDELCASWPTFFRGLRKSTTSAFHSLSLDFFAISKDILISECPELFLLNLDEFRVEGLIFSKISKDHLISLVQSWPHLKVLRLSATDWDVPFDGLVHIAQKLLNLHTLEMGLKIRKPPSSPELPIPLLSHPLRSITLTVSGTIHPATFARQLDRIFPNLFSFVVNTEFKTPYGNPRPMKDVTEFLRCLQEVRADQMERLKLQ